MVGIKEDLRMAVAAAPVAAAAAAAAAAYPQAKRFHLASTK
jgi:hypothetical protein